MKKKELTLKNADKHFLYEKSVQDSEFFLEFLEQVYSTYYSDFPLKLREDFCGTALFCSAWVKSNSKRISVGVDIDETTLEWGRQKNIEPLLEDKKRVTLLCNDVLKVPAKNDFHIIVALNFSYFVFKERQVLLSYFKRVYDSLSKKGVFIIDLYGGPDAQFILTESLDKDGFEYSWEQASFDPVSNETICHIHFKFNDASVYKKAFTYDWRLWTLPELRDLLKEAGFSKTDTWLDQDNGNDDYEICTKAVNSESWIAYISAVK